MNDNIDFKDLWNKQPAVVAPDKSELLKRINRLRTKTRNQLLFKNILLALTVAWIMFIVLYFKPERMTTKIGSLMIILAIIIMIITSSGIVKMLFEMKSNDADLKNYLNTLLRLREKQLFLQTTIMNIYFVLFSTGMFLYMIEYCNRMSLAGAAFTYGLTSAWILFAWLYLRKRQMKKEQEKLNEVISGLQKVNEQLKNDA